MKDKWRVGKIWNDQEEKVENVQTILCRGKWIYLQTDKYSQ